MQVEPEKPPHSDSNESVQKAGRGGKRPGAGRRPNIAKRLLKGFTRSTIAEAVQNLDVGTVIDGLLRSKSDRTRLETLAFLRDTLHGRPAQSVNLSGAMVHSHAVWRPLAELTDDEMQLLDSITKKLTAPAASEALQDAPQNQIESNRASEMMRVESASDVTARAPGSCLD